MRKRALVEDWPRVLNEALLSRAGMLAGGSGITPMFQVALAILRNEQDRTVVHLVYANVAEEDILLRKQLDAWARMHPDRFKASVALLLHCVWMCPCIPWQHG